MLGGFPEVTELIMRPADPPGPRRSRRVNLDANITIRRAGFPNYQVKIRDLSAEGCKFEFVDRPRVGEVCG